jgi:hypothetical protein
MPSALTRSSGDALDIDLLDQSRKRPSQPSGAAVAALAKLRDGQFDRAHARLRNAVAVAAALDEPVW